MLTDGKISPADLDLLQIIDDPEQVVKYIKKYIIV
jgi:predicted Rossmann-fold nucleotide-binding protein